MEDTKHKTLINDCPFPKVNCLICGGRDRFNKIICDDCRVAGIKIVEKYYDGSLKFEDIETIIKKKDK